MFLAISIDSGVVLPPVKIQRVTPNKRTHCRFCAKEKNNTELLNFAINTDINNHLIAMLTFFKIDFVDLFNSRLPTTICHACYNEVQKCYNFFLFVKDSQINLKQLYCNDEVGNNKIKSEPLDHLENNGDIKQEEIIQNNIFSQATEFESKPNMHQLINSPGTSNLKVENFEMEQNTVPIEYVHDTNVSEKNSESILNLKQFVCKWDDTSKAREEMAEKIENKKKKNYRFHHQTVTDSSISKSGCQPVLNSDLQKSENISWTSYPWHCKHCKLKCDTMLDLRNHSMQLHKCCFAYLCGDCSESFNMFHQFVEHLRRHRPELRYYCPHCNERFSSVAGCTQHVLAYWSSGHKICNWCGEVYPTADALNAHKSMSRHVRIPKKEWKKPHVVVPPVSRQKSTWENYEWGCLECDLNFVSVGDLRVHSQAVHDKCFAMRCADCLAVKQDYPHFVTHVMGHRPNLKEYCAYCNQHFADANELEKHTEDHFVGAQRACYGCGQIFQNKDEETQHFEQFNPRRLKKYLTTEDLTCPVCKKVLCDVKALRLHKRIHDEIRKKDHCCHLCGKQFINKPGLQNHMISHNNDRKYECKVCHQHFVCEQYLKRHVMTHTKPFICDYCSKGFSRKLTLKTHINNNHNNSTVIRKYKCTFCPKRFMYKGQLTTHLNHHTGATPFKCQSCGKSFLTWGNCNGHMIRMHGTTLAKSKLTERGKVPIGEEMPDITSNVEEWMAEVTKPKRDKKL